MTMTKSCQCCGRVLPVLAQFARLPAPSIGFRDICQNCEMLQPHEVAQFTRATVEREYALQRNSKAVRKSDRLAACLARYAAEGKRCGSCYLSKPVVDFSKCAPRSDGLQPYCRACDTLRRQLLARPAGLALWQTVRAEMRKQNKS